MEHGYTDGLDTGIRVSVMGIAVTWIAIERRNDAPDGQYCSIDYERYSLSASGAACALASCLLR